MGGDDGACVPPSACSGLSYMCTEPTPPTFTMLMGASTIGGPKARGAKDDMLLENGVVRVVLDAPSHPSGLAPSGGSIIDLSLVSKPGDQINQIYQAAGLLPRDAVHYEGNPEPLDRGHGGRGLRLRRVSRPPGGEPARHGRHALRAAGLRARRARSHRPLQRVERTEHAVPRRRIVLGRQRRLAVRARHGAWFSRARAEPARHRRGLAGVAVRRRPDAGAARRLLRDRFLRSSDGGGFQQPDADRIRCSAGDDAARRRHPSRTLHPRPAGPRARRRRQRGAARPCHGARRAGCRCT